MAGRAAGEGPAVASLPFLTTPHDNLRCGLPALKADAQLVHPVQAIQQNVRAWLRPSPARVLRAWQRAPSTCRALRRPRVAFRTTRAHVLSRAHAPAPPRALASPQRMQVTSAVAMQTNLYGSAFPARAAIERQILGRRVVRCCRVALSLALALRLPAHDSLPLDAPQNAAPAGLRHPLRAPRPRHPQRCAPRRAAPRALTVRNATVTDSLPPSLYVCVPPGEVDDFGFESYLGFPGEKEACPVGTIHTVMEARLGLSPATATERRPGF
jgi:hypothetical protein